LNLDTDNIIAVSLHQR